MTHHYCAIAATDEHYILAAISQHPEIIFEGFTYAPLPILAQQFNNYGLALAVSDQDLDIQTHFFPPQDAGDILYQKIARQSAISEHSGYFDFEPINSAEQNNEEQLVISYHLRDAAFIAPYQQLGFTLAALEPLSIVQKRTLQHTWQKQALKDLFNAPHAFDPTLAERTLKLLDRDNFYASLNP